MTLHKKYNSFDKIRNCALILFFFLTLHINAQDVSALKQDDRCKVTMTGNKTMDLEFSAEKKSGNLLVILVDNFGNTAFLDSQHDFTGIYKHSIDVSKYTKGDYCLKIVSDTEVVNKKLSIN